MTTNVGTLDRVLRAVLGVVLLYLAFGSGLPLFDGALFKYGAAVIGVVMLVVAVVRVCPLYSAIGIKTCRA
jgi:cytochrome c oxidase assembly factor CtaG